MPRRCEGEQSERRTRNAECRAKPGRPGRASALRSALGILHAEFRPLLPADKTAPRVFAARRRDKNAAADAAEGGGRGAHVTLVSTRVTGGARGARWAGA